MKIIDSMITKAVTDIETENEYLENMEKEKQNGNK